VRQCLDLLLRAQSSGGGWGPYPQSPAEAFDTAVAVLGLQKLNEPDRTGKAIARGRDFLIARQQPYGGWQETTRPPGSQSYAQHISTTAWATLALILTDSKR
jgi:squalene cyclase